MKPMCNIAHFIYTDAIENYVFWGIPVMLNLNTFVLTISYFIYKNPPDRTCT